MPFIDTAAAARIRELREERGLSPEALAREIRLRADEEGWRIPGIDPFTIRRFEGTEERWPLVPSLRTRVVIGLYFGVPHNELWRDHNRVWVDSPFRRQRERVAA